MKILVCLLVFTAFSSQADWPQFRGASGNNTSSETGLYRSWPSGGPDILWAFLLGPGFAGSAVRDGEVYILDRFPDERDILRCIDLKTGKEKWRYEYSAPGKFSVDGSRSTPTVTDKYVFSVGPLGHFHCVSRETHKPVWTRHIINDFEGKRPTWVVTQSPLVYKDTVIVAPQGKLAGVVAYTQDIGAIVWQTPGLGAMSYTSPSLTTIDGVDQVVMISDRGLITGIDAKTGEILWEYTQWQCKVPIASPAFVGEGRIFITGEYNAGSLMIQIVRKDGHFVARKVFHTQECGAQIHQPLVYNDHIYLASNGNRRRDGFVCLDMNGTVKWKTGRHPNFGRGAMLLADGLIYAVDGETGVLALIEPSPERFSILTQAQVLDGKQVWAPMALSNGKLLLRDQTHLKCIRVGPEKP